MTNSITINGVVFTRKSLALLSAYGVGEYRIPDASIVDGVREDGALVFAMDEFRAAVAAQVKAMNEDPSSAVLLVSSPVTVTEEKRPYSEDEVSNVVDNVKRALEVGHVVKVSITKKPTDVVDVDRDPPWVVDDVPVPVNITVKCRHCYTEFTTSEDTAPEHRKCAYCGKDQGGAWVDTDGVLMPMRWRVPTIAAWRAFEAKLFDDKKALAAVLAALGKSLAEADDVISHIGWADPSVTQLFFWLSRPEHRKRVRAEWFAESFQGASVPQLDAAMREFGVGEVLDVHSPMAQEMLKNSHWRVLVDARRTELCAATARVLTAISAKLGANTTKMAAHIATHSATDPDKAWAALQAGFDKVGGDGEFLRASLRRGDLPWEIVALWFKGETATLDAWLRGKTSYHVKGR